MYRFWSPLTIYYHQITALSLIFLSAWYITVPSATSAPNIASEKEAKKEKTPSTQRSQGVPLDIAKHVTLFLALLTPFISYRFPITLRKPLLEPYTHPTQPVRILSSVRSNTGVIVVGEALKRPSNLPPLDPSDPHAVITESRFLRADHSILGGVWVGDKAHSIDGRTPVNFDASGAGLGDSIYSTFVLQEAARFVRSTNPQTALTM